MAKPRQISYETVTVQWSACERNIIVELFSQSVRFGFLCYFSTKQSIAPWQRTVELFLLVLTAKRLLHSFWFLVILRWMPNRRFFMMQNAEFPQYDLLTWRKILKKTKFLGDWCVQLTSRFKFGKKRVIEKINSLPWSYYTTFVIVLTNRFKICCTHITHLLKWI